MSQSEGQTELFIVLYLYPVFTQSERSLGYVKVRGQLCVCVKFNKKESFDNVEIIIIIIVS